MDSKTCETCGNYYEQSMVIHTPDGGKHVFDSFECAIQKLAPTCTHCSCRIIGHGVEHDDVMYCCESCVRMGHRDLGAGEGHTRSAEPHEEDQVSVAAAQSFPASDPPSF